MITLEVNGVKVEAETEKEARKQLRTLVKQAEKEAKERSARHEVARTKAQAWGYRLLCSKVQGDMLHWTLYRPTDRYFEHLAKPGQVDHYFPKQRIHSLNTESGWIEYDHYGYELVGVACNGSGFAFAVAIRSMETDTPTIVYAIGAEGDAMAFADCPTVTPEDFKQSRHENAA